MTDDYGADYWEDRYAHGHGHGHGGHGHRSAEPSPHLPAELAGLAPGRALDAGCGEGANALWLAERGWTVTGVDISPTALERAAEQAAAQDQALAGGVAWHQADLTAWEPPVQAFDLVISLYVHTPGPFERLVRRLARAVAPGGTLLVVAHSPADEHSAAHAPAPAAQTAEEMAGWLDEAPWEVQRAGRRTHSTHRPDGREVVLDDAVLRARRGG